LALQLTVPQTGFVPGQSIPLSVLITNDSHIPVEQLLMSFVMLVTYHSKPPSMPNFTCERLVVNTMKGDSVQRNCKKLFTYEIRVPATPPTCFNLCGIIQIAYQVEVEAKVKGCHNNEIVSIPVTIGSVPLAQHVPIQPRGMIGQPLDVNGLAGGNVPTAPTPNASSPWAVDDSIREFIEFANCLYLLYIKYLLLAPPNYQEALHMRSTAAAKTDDLDDPEPVQPNTLDLDGSAYKPLYPVFDIPSPSAPPPADYTQNYMAERAFVNPAMDVDKDKGTWL